MASDLQFAVVIPAHNAAWCLEDCLLALRLAGFDLGSEVTVVDDGSTDDTETIALGLGAEVLRHSHPRGAAAARQTGAAKQTADVILFVDSDVTVAPDTRRTLAAAFIDDTIDAVFGAYDDAPKAPGWVSQYRNLLHRYVHLEAAGAAKTFWTGIGAVRRTAYLAMGGINPDQRMMEDVEFGMRLHAGGHKIMLIPEITGTHLKAWTWSNMARTDLFDRAIPWTRLLIENPTHFAEMNLSSDRKLAALAAVGVPFGLLLSLVHPVGLVFAGLSILAFAAISWPFLKWLASLRGPLFAGFSLLPHMVHNWCAIAGYLIARLTPRACSSPIAAANQRKG